MKGLTLRRTESLGISLLLLRAMISSENASSVATIMHVCIACFNSSSVIGNYKLAPLSNDKATSRFTPARPPWLPATNFETAGDEVWTGMEETSRAHTDSVINESGSWLSDAVKTCAVDNCDWDGLVSHRLLDLKLSGVMPLVQSSAGLSLSDINFHCSGLKWRRIEFRRFGWLRKLDACDVKNLSGEARLQSQFSIRWMI
jgi:hypothetical protein